MDKLENKIEEQCEANQKKLVEEIIQKWLLLQKTVKEEITLEEIITKQQENDTKKLKEYFREFYNIKIKSRKVFEDIKNLKIYEDKKNNDKTKIKEFYIENEEDKVLLEANEPIRNLLFLLRNNYDYVVKLISLIDYQDEKEQIESLVELFCNQFYDNILIPNPEQEELLILIYKLLEEEITPMNSASIDQFMHNSTFLGKFISLFMKRQELNVFLAILLNPLIASIENENEECLDISLFSIQNHIKNELIKEKGKKKKVKMFADDKNTKNENDDILTDEKDLFTNIPKTKIHFKKNRQIEAEKEEENRRTNYDMETSSKIEEDNLKINSNISSNENEYNVEYLDFLTQEKISKKVQEEKDKDIKELYEHQLEQINSDPDIFSNKGLIEVLNEPCFQNEKNEKNLIMTKYKKNFLFIQKKVDTIIQSLIDKITSIPYTVRCISKLISLLISKKFPLLSKYLQNAFIGKFIFNKCIFPVLSLENKNVVENNIFSSNTKKCLNVIISVLSTANKCLLYNYNLDTEKTIFNYYLLEIIPILNKFYEKLIDIELPKTLNDLVLKIKDNMEDNPDNNIFSIRRRQNVGSSEENKIQKYTPTPSYDYFSDNSDEIMKIQTICFSLSDIFTIMNLINKDPSKFKGLPKYDSFLKTVEIIQSNEYKLDQQLEQETTRRRFFVIYKEEKNSQLEKLFKQKKIIENDNAEQDFVRLKIKDCIKKILKGLNVLNNKDYSYLNMASSNEKFLQAIQYTLEDIQEISENEREIPLSWYGKFISNNKKSLDPSYLENDLEKLYEELYNEETNILNELKSYSSIIITRDGMNLRCAEKIIEKAKSDQRRIIKAKKLQKIENFIEKDKTNVCIRIRGINSENKNEKEKGIKSFFGKKEGKNEPFSFISVVDIEKCQHKNTSTEGEKKAKYITHVESINEFISKFSDFGNEQKKEDLKIMHQFIVDDIRKGEAEHEVYKAFNEYMVLLKENIKKSKRYIENTEEKALQKELDEFTNKIEEYIMRRIYKYVYPKDPLPEDNKFYQKTKALEWVTPEHLEIKKLYINQLGLAIYWIKKMDDAKSVLDKIRCIQNAHSNVNNNIRFSSGKDKDAGSDETTPIFHYIVIKAQPKRIISNINYIHCFFDMVNGGPNAFLVTQLKSVISFILNISHENLNISKEEFEKNMTNSKMKYKF